MQVVLAALNARYSHSSLALRYLRRYCERQFPDLETVEFNINQSPRLILGSWPKESQMFWAFPATSGTLS